MTKYPVKVLGIHHVTHDVKSFRVEKPSGYKFISGQATDVAINLPGWTGELRPFTFTCLPDKDYLEFTIKIYTDHAGVTNMLGQIQPGAELILHDVFGVIQYQGTGIFLAGGAGITPFISIFRYLNRNKQLHGNKLIYSNKTPDDVILENELKQMLGPDFIRIFTRENPAGSIQRIDKKFLTEKIQNFDQHFYVCGPDEFVKTISELLVGLGAKADTVVFEK